MCTRFVQSCIFHHVPTCTAVNRAVKGVSVKPGLWTHGLDYGLDCGLRFGLNFGLMLSSITTISKRLWIRRYYNCKLVKRSWPGGYL